MRILNARTVAVAISTLILGTLPAIAKPFLYSSTYSYSGNSDKCIKGAEAALRKHGFGDFEYDKAKKERWVVITGWHSSEFITALINCDPKLGTSTLGVSGIDPDLTYDMYEKLHKAPW